MRRLVLASDFGRRTGSGSVTVTFDAADVGRPRRRCNLSNCNPQGDAGGFRQLRLRKHEIVAVAFTTVMACHAMMSRTPP